MKYNVSGIGNPLLDLTLEVGEDVLIQFGFQKGGMFLVKESEIHNILKKIKTFDVKISAGGSVANVLAGVSLLGGSSVLLGKIGRDEYAIKYLEATRIAGTESRLKEDANRSTGHAITFITPDGERTFAVHLGAAVAFRKQDIDVDAIANSQILHLEGFKIEDSKESDTIQYALKIARDNNVKISLDLSDSELIKRNLDYLRKFVQDYVDIVFANEDEALVFTGKREAAALAEIAKMCDLAVVKIGERGSLIQHNDNIYDIQPNKVKIENTNGAGDMYAAGILYGLTNGIPLEEAANKASYYASLVVAKEAARLDSI